MSGTSGPAGTHITLPEMSEATGVPAAAICRYLDLNIIVPVQDVSGRELFRALEVAPVIALRSMELLDCPVQEMRGMMRLLGTISSAPDSVQAQDCQLRLRDYVERVQDHCFTNSGRICEAGELISLLQRYYGWPVAGTVSSGTTS